MTCTVKTTVARGRQKRVSFLERQVCNTPRSTTCLHTAARLVSSTTTPTPKGNYTRRLRGLPRECHLHCVILFHTDKSLKTGEKPTRLTHLQVVQAAAERQLDLPFTSAAVSGFHWQAHRVDAGQVLARDNLDIGFTRFHQQASGILDKLPSNVAIAVKTQNCRGGSATWTTFTHNVYLYQPQGSEDMSEGLPC